MSVARIAGHAFTSMALALVVFAVVRSMPGEPAASTLFLTGAVVTPEAVAGLRSAHGLDAPFQDQFIRWLAGLATGDWGRSMRTGEPILPGMLARLPVSLAIGGGGLAAGAVAAYWLALPAAAGSRLADLASRGLALLAQALPAFVAGLVLVYVFGVKLRWVRPFTGGPVETVLLPMAIVALYACGTLSRLVVRHLRDAMATAWFTTARAKGLSLSGAIRGHAGAFGIIALLAALKVEAAWVVGGTAVSEVLFGSAGLSAWVVESVSHRDYAILQAYIVVVTLWLFLVHLLVDFSVRRIDPRVPHP